MEDLKENEYVHTTDCDDLDDKVKLPLKRTVINTTVMGMDGRKRKRKDSSDITSDTGTLCVCF